MTKVKAAVFASGTGSNFQAMMGEENLACEIVLLVCDQADAVVLEKAAKNNVSTLTINPSAYDSKISYEKEIIQALHEAQVDWIFLAGYMRMIGPTLLNAYRKRIINIHPSLLPAFPGLDAIGQAFQAGVTTTGVTIHYVDEGMDTGPIIAQEKVEVNPEDTYELLKAKIQKVEHRLYPKVIYELIK